MPLRALCKSDDEVGTSSGDRDRERCRDWCGDTGSDRDEAGGGDHGGAGVGDRGGVVQAGREEDASLTAEFSLFILQLAPLER